ncbi:hypothetical protein FMEAI12_5210002 [Parafrankia sp. Ea1.12]|nr:hypothetical protein FMEAI12_5210002 [Parafrankia sp. Ea1.12]
MHAEHPVGAFGGGVQRPAVVQITHDDLCAGLANRIARGLVIPPHRDGGQAQYVSAPVPTDDDGRLAAVLAWARAHLGDRISVDLLAARALMSRRSFTRHFRLATGTSPTRGCAASACPSPRNCWRHPTCPSSRSRIGSATAARPSCVNSSSYVAGCRPATTAVPSAVPDRAERGTVLSRNSALRAKCCPPGQVQPSAFRA